MRRGDYVVPRKAGFGEDRPAQVVGIVAPGAGQWPVATLRIRYWGMNFDMERMPYELRIASVSEVLWWKHRNEPR